MKNLRAAILILLLMLGAAPLAFIKPTLGNPAYIHFTVKPIAVPPLTDVDPSPYVLHTPEKPSPVGQNFTVEIHLENATVENWASGVQGLEVKFYFGNILDYAVPVAYETMLGKPGGALNPTVLTTRDGFYNATEGEVKEYPYTGAVMYWVAGASTGAAWFGADGLVAKITFKIIKQPQLMLSEPTVSFPLELTFTDLADPSAAPIPHDRINGQLIIETAPPTPPPRPQIFVEPAIKKGKMNEIFTVDIKIRGEDGAGVDAFWDIAGFDITFIYNSTLLSLVSATEGHFLKQHDEQTWGWIDTSTPGKVWAVFTKLENPAPSSGIDTLLTIQLQVIYEATTYPPPTCVLGLVNTDLASWAHPERLMEPWGGRITAVELPYDPTGAIYYGHSVVNGTYIAPLKFIGPAIDVYTQYPEPYGGQGPNEHSDAFAPQMMVWLYAKVTYNGDRVTNKLVTFEVHNALGEKVTILENYTDLNGIATVHFRIPQTDLIPGGEDPAIFGWWTVIATVEVAEKTVTDTLTFQVGWLIKVVSVESLSASYLKYQDTMQFKVTIQTISEQTRHAIITVDTFDAENFPIGEAIWEGDFNATRIRDPHGTTGGIYTNTLTISIPTWAFVGEATVRAVALTDFPKNGGTAYCPTAEAKFGITAG